MNGYNINPRSLENLNRNGFIGDRNKMSESIKEYFKTHKHPRGMLGKIAWNKGKKLGRNYKASETKKRLYDEGKIKKMVGNLNPMKREEVKDKVREALMGKPQPWNKGENCHFWKGGISSEIQQRLNDLNWTNIRKQIYKRDNWMCQDCGTKSRKLSCHHIIPYRISKDNSIRNLITLCNQCHAKRDRGLNGINS